MPYGYLATVLLWGTVTAVLLRPPRRPLGLARLAHLLGVLLNEVPALLVLALGLATAQAVALDQVHRSWVGASRSCWRRSSWQGRADCSGT